MSRTIQDTFFAETLSAGAVGTSPASVVTSMIGTRLAAFLSNGTPAWAQVASGLSGGLIKNPGAVALWTATDMDVYHTVGDRNLVGGVGDTSGYVVFDAFSATQLRAAQGHDWSTPDQALATDDNAATWNFSASVAMNIWGSANEYEMFFLINQDAVWNRIWFGVPVRTQAPPGHRGVARTTAAVTGGIGNQQIPVDRDLTDDLIVGEDIWLVNQTADGDSQAATTIDVVPVVSVGAGFVECNPTNSFLINAVLGLDPCPVGRLTSSAMAMNFGTTELGAYAAASYQGALASQISEPGNDPSALGYYRGYRMEIHNTGVGNQSHRGVPSLFTFWTEDAAAQDYPANGDVNRHNFDDTKLFAPFPGSSMAVGAFTMNLGPFETVMP